MTWPDVVVVGAGIIGAACAEALACAGLRVTVVDEALATGATAAAMGHILVVDDDPALLALTRRGRALWQARAETLPPAAEWEPAGTLWVATDDDELELAHHRLRTLRRANVEAEVLDPVSVRGCEPRLVAGLAGALWVPGDRTIYPPVAARYLLRCAVAHGARLELGHRVRALRSDGVQLSDGTNIHAARVVLATGTGLELLAERAARDPGAHLAVRPRKGHLAITRSYPRFLRHHVAELGYFASTDPGVSESVAFNVQPRRSGQLLIGASRQLSFEGRAVERRIAASMLRRALRFIPELEQLEILRVWAGFRPATHDKLPLVGPVPERPSVLLATGHEGLGITTALVTGELIRDAVVGTPPSIDARPFSVGRRIAWRSSA